MSLVVGTNSYIDVADASTYFSDALHADDWTLADATTKAQALVTATRMLERQQWVGTKADEGQTLSWPRSGVSDSEGNPVDDSEVPQFILDAECELALALIQDLTVQTQPDVGSNLQTVKAGSVSLTFFATETTGPRFPTIINELIGYYLAGASTFIGPLALGITNESQLNDYELSAGY